ncbi:hypothetical protein ACJMK2_024300 [Sinanodonta woodiana]|uniref:Short-chain collagen C4 n=1 Tax=Sinanodonta woodiana TaxID=1069815 RepID=A0ABD3T8D5_SINWO
MYLILCSLFVCLVVGERAQPTSSPNSNCYARFDYEYKLLERLLRAEFAQREMEASILQIQEKFKSIERDAQESRRPTTNATNGFGSTYVRWGRTTCSGNDTEMVYKGYAGGSDHADTGGSADFLCLPEDPTWGKNVLGSAPSGFIYGAEYELVDGSNPFSVSREDDVPCCVCKPPRTASLMIPGRTNCYLGWTMEYTGYLMSGYHGHSGATNYVCVDANAEATIRGNINYNGHLMYIVTAKCGSLPCPPYVEGKIVACVVCSR